MQTPARVRRRIAKAPVKKIPAKAARVKPPLPFDLRNLLLTLQAVRDGNFSVRIGGDYEGIEGKIAETLNEIIASNQRLSQEMSRAGQLVGKEGKYPFKTHSNAYAIFKVMHTSDFIFDLFSIFPLGLCSNFFFYI